MAKNYQHIGVHLPDEVFDDSVDMDVVVQFVRATVGDSVQPGDGLAGFKWRRKRSREQRARLLRMGWEERVVGYFYKLCSPVAGVIEAIHVNEDDRVRKGHLIATVRVWASK
jgi:hypothetical protein